MGLKHKVFLNLLDLINKNSQKAKLHLSDKRMTFQEKMILNAALALRDCENQDAIDILKPISAPDQFIESQRLHMLGIAYNQMSKYPEAIKFLNDSIALNEYVAGRDRKLSAYQTLFTVHLNSNEVKAMVETLERIKALPWESELLKMVTTSCEFALAIQQNDFELAHSFIARMENFFPELNEYQSVTYLYELFELHLAQDNFKAVLEVMGRLRKLRKFKNTVQIKFMQSLVNYLTRDMPIYLYEREYEEYPVLQEHIRCLMALGKGDQKTALESWEALKAIQPHNFGEPYKYLGLPNLFSKCLGKLLAPVKTIEVKVVDSFEAQLLLMLSESSIPVPMDTIYQALWKKPAESKLDYKKLVKVVQRARQKYDVEIKSVKGAYALVAKKKAS